MAGRFVSKAQWRMAFARKLPFARKWAHRNQARQLFRTLPQHHNGTGMKGRRRR